MYIHPEALMVQAAEYRRQRLADAEQHRLLTAARRARKARRARQLGQTGRARPPVPWRRADLPQQC